MTDEREDQVDEHEASEPSDGDTAPPSGATEEDVASAGAGPGVEDESEEDQEGDSDEEDDEEDEDEDDDEDEDEQDAALAENTVHIVVPSSLGSGESAGVDRSLAVVQAEFDQVVAQAARLAKSAVAKTPRGLEIDEITFSLGFDGAGKIGFMVGGTGGASIEVSFKGEDD